jgi:hypothetical protein
MGREKIASIIKNQPCQDEYSAEKKGCSHCIKDWNLSKKPTLEIKYQNSGGPNNNRYTKITANIQKKTPIFTMMGSGLSLISNC